MSGFQLDTSGDHARRTVPVYAADHPRLYYSWKCMHERCANPNNHNYPRYGGRGVSVCDEWQKWDAFLAWALSAGYVAGLTIDRLNVDGDYEPANCRWATAKEQSVNRSNVAKDADGIAYCEIAAANGIRANTYTARLSRGWSPARAATAAPKPALGRHSRRPI